MAVISCKMCGGELILTEGEKTARCAYCDTLQTIPEADNEKKLTFFARANRLRMNCEFDKAAGIYENLAAEFPEEAEAYWGLVLCKYGIEYVDDPATGKKIPTCHRSSFDSVMEDDDLEQALENADVASRRLYREEAKQIEELRKGILEVSGREEPYDIFICYKETDENGQRTLDSVLAQDIYDALTDKGYRVFFARITLEDKLGQEYEPYIFAALNSAKIMLAVGTDYEYYNAVWVKNEWSRYLKLMAKDKGKHLIPCYKNLDAYDMPKEFAKLQAQDLGKLGATQDLLRGVEKILPRREPIQSAVKVNSEPMRTSAALLRRGMMALEDAQWDKADAFFENVLNGDPECAEAYLGLAMCESKVANLEALVECGTWNTINYRRAKQFADDTLLNRIHGIENQKRQKVEQERIARETEITRLPKLQKRLCPIQKMIAAWDIHAVGLRSDGTVVTVGDNSYGQRNVFAWGDIIAVAAGKYHTVGLRSDGTVVATGRNWEDQCGVSDWSDIVDIRAGAYHTMGLRRDGTVVTAGVHYGGRYDVSEWTNIVAIATEQNHTVGLRSDGTVVATGRNWEGQCEVSDWNNIVDIAAGDGYTVGLCSDGTVVAAGCNSEDRCNISNWKDIVAIAVGDSHTVGLRSDGTVVAVGDNYDYQCEVAGWTEIVAIAAGERCTVGLQKDGTAVVTVGSQFDQSDVADWQLFDDFENLEQEQVEKRKEQKLKEPERIKIQRRMDKGLCRHCGGALKGLFNKKCVGCGKIKDY